MKNQTKNLEVIGFKSKSEMYFLSSTAIILIGFVAAFYIFFFQNFINSNKLDFVIVIILFAIVLTSGCIFMIILSVLALICPKELIAFTESGIILLTKNKTIPLQEVVRISSKLAYVNTGISKSSNPGFGKIIIKTSSERIVQRHLRNAHSVAEKLKALCQLE